MFSPNLVVLAGFMRIVSSVFTNVVKAVNIHPSLLPLFKGANAIKESFESGMQVAGVTVHWVTNELDGGPIILQEAIKKDVTDTLESFENKIHDLEYDLFPRAILIGLDIKY
jgi:phosphoribosylglycinamide formyltransferase-1